MRNRKRYGWIVFLGIAIFIVYRFRFEIINGIQKQVLETIREEARHPHPKTANANQDQTHLAYSLIGLDKIWPHRVNSLERLRYLYNDFAGFECDIRFNSNNHHCYIAHDSSELDSLIFDDYLNLADPDHKLFWLDTKNLNAGNVDDFCRELDELDKRWQIRNRIIVESSDTAALNKIEAGGWLSSYYLPPIAASAQSEQDYLNATAAWINEHRSLISQEASMHAFLSSHFPEKKQLAWDLRFGTA